MESAASLSMSLINTYIYTNKQTAKHIHSSRYRLVSYPSAISGIHHHVPFCGTLVVWLRLSTHRNSASSSRNRRPSSNENHRDCSLSDPLSMRITEIVVYQTL